MKNIYLDKNIIPDSIECFRCKETKENDKLTNSIENTSYKVPIININKDVITECDSDVICDYPLSFIVNEKYENTFLCTPSNLKELVIGYLASKGDINSKSDIVDLNIDIKKQIAQVTIEKKQGLDNEEMIFVNSLDYIKCASVKSNLGISIDNIFKIMDRNLTSSKLFRDTGGVHSVGIFDCNKNEVVICEDVARHNAMDKAIGYCVLNEISLKNKVVVLSGRASFEMILKVAQMQIPIVISKSAPTRLAIELATKLNITLVGFVRGHTMNIYANGNRVFKTVHCENCENTTCSLSNYKNKKCIKCKRILTVEKISQYINI